MVHICTSENALTKLCDSQTHMTVLKRNDIIKAALSLVVDDYTFVVCGRSKNFAYVEHKSSFKYM